MLVSVPRRGTTCVLPERRRSAMSLRPQAIYVVPDETARVARAAFPKGNA